MDGMNFINRDWHPESWQECQADLLRYALAAWAVFFLIFAVTLTAIVILDEAGIHLPVVDGGFDTLGWAG